MYAQQVGRVDFNSHERAKFVMSQKFIGYRKFVQVGTTPGGRVQIFGVDEYGQTHSGEIIAKQDRQLIANVLVSGGNNLNDGWKALKLEMYADGNMPDFTPQPPASVFIVSILPWDVYKVERFDGGTRWVPATALPGTVRI